MIDWLSLSLGITLGILLGGFCVMWFLYPKYQKEQESAVKLREEKSRLDTLVDQITAQSMQFENLATRVLDNNSQKLKEQNQESLQHLLNPLKDRLQAFEQKVEDTYQKEARERHSLKNEVEQLHKLNMEMSEEARNLTRALKGDSKTQGNWGEVILSRVLESSGLREGKEFVVQGKEMDLQSINGRRLQPDVIINLPDAKHLIVDAKVSLTAYERFVDAEPEYKAIQMKQHLDSMQKHIKELSEKHYSGLEALNSPDFVLMFMPIEPAFSIAIHEKPDLFTFAWERKIVLVSPSTLLATLKTVASIWQIDQQNANAKEIARQGGALYDKFVLFVEEMEKVGKSIDKASDSYHQAMQRLSQGRGNLISRAEKLQELGAKTQKQLEKKFPSSDS